MATSLSTDGPDADPLDWCRRRLLMPGHPLALTLPYAAPEIRDSLLSLHAVISEIAAIPDAVSEPEVARRKLDWWRQALVRGERHPALLAWRASGGDARLAPTAFTTLLDAVALEIEPPRFDQNRELYAHADHVAGPAASLEAQLIGGETPSREALESVAGAAYRIRIVRDLVLDARQDRWLVPLELQAEFQLTRQQVAAGAGEHRLRALVRGMAADALRDLDRGLGVIDAGVAWRHRHWMLRMGLERRLGKHLLQRPARVVRERVTAAGPLAGFAVWRQARRLRAARP
ncbi:MAG: phytoene/squalene synthase family protein [Wenzhouxiangellaceae bacterium]